MTQVQLETDIAEWLLQITFISSVLFAFTYGFLFDWRITMTGRSVMMLDLAIGAALLRSVLLLWGVDIIRIAPGSRGKVLAFNDFDQALSWISIVAVGLAGVAIIMLLWQCIRFRLAEADVHNRYLGYAFALNGKKGNHSKIKSV